MRSEQEMYDLILKIANEDERILAVYMNGSRTNKNVPKDMFQDYDIVYVVYETKSFREDKEWIKKFGKILFMQYPDESVYYPSDVENLYGWLMQFEDGNRIDLHVETVSHMQKEIQKDQLCKILLDKQGILPDIEVTTDRRHWVKKPTKEEFRCTCNEFWWLQDNLAKGLWRKEIPYAMDVLNGYIRPQLIRMLSWKAGIRTDFSCSVGKCGKYLYRYLPQKDWEQFLLTYPSANIEEMWNAAIYMCALFDHVAREIAEKLEFTYEEEEAFHSFAYLKRVRRLPDTAQEI